MSQPGLARHFNSPQFSDIIIKFSGHEVYAHKVLLTSASPYFAKMFENGFKETTSPTIELHEDPPEALKTILQYCYHQTHELELDNSLDKATHLTNLVDLYITAGKYLMPQLQQLAEDTLVEKIELSDRRHMCREAPPTTLPSWFSSIAHYIFKLDEAEDLQGRLIHELTINTYHLKDDAEFKKLMLEIPALGFEVLKAVAEAKKKAEEQSTQSRYHRPHLPVPSATGTTSGWPGHPSWDNFFAPLMEGEGPRYI